MIIPNIWKNKNVPKHQPVYIYMNMYVYIIYTATFSEYIPLHGPYIRLISTPIDPMATW